MSQAAVQAAIYTLFFEGGASGWTKATWPVVAANQNWEGVDAKQPEAQAWCRFSVRYADNRNATIDAKFGRITGKAWLQIFVPANKGELKAAEMGDELDRVLGNKTITGGGETIRFEKAVTRYIGKDSAGWEMHAATIDFIADSATP